MYRRLIHLLKQSSKRILHYPRYTVPPLPVRRPTFIGVGAQKCGTTSVLHYLDQHPAILMARSVTDSTEVHYFDTEHYPEHDWYQSRFTLGPTKNLDAIRATGDITPSYCFSPNAIEKIHEYDNTVKLFMLVRNPIKRAISHYWMMVNNGQETLSMAEAFEQEARRTRIDLGALRRFAYLQRGHYHEQISHMMTYFSPEQVLILRTEDLKQDPAGTMPRLLILLGLNRLKSRISLIIVLGHIHRLTRRSASNSTPILGRTIAASPVIFRWTCPIGINGDALEPKT